MQVSKKIISLILSLVFVLSCATNIIAEDAGEWDAIGALGKDASFSNMAAATEVRGSVGQIVEKAGRGGWRMTSRNWYYNSIFIDVKSLPICVGQNVLVEVDYYDEGSNGWFCLEYNGRDRQGLYTNKVCTTGTNLWKTAQFILYAPTMADDLTASQHSADFAVTALCSNMASVSDITIGSVRVKALDTVKSADVKIEFAEKTRNYYDNGNFEFDLIVTDKSGKRVMEIYRNEAMHFKYSKEPYYLDRYHHSQTCCNNDKINALKNLLKITFATKHEDFNKHSELINVKNCVVNLKNGMTMPHDKKYLFSYFVDVNYNERAEGVPSIFNNFLFQICSGNGELVKYLQNVFGYAITSETREQTIFFMHGTGSNGKTTLIEALGNVLGGLVQHLSIDIIVGRPDYKSGSKASPEIARAENSRLIFTSESNDGDSLNEGKVKNLTGGGTITARQLYREPIEFKPNFKIFVDTNHLPVIKGTEYAIWRRIKVIPFKATFNSQNGDKDLMYKLQAPAEKECILAWLVAGAVQYYQNGLAECDDVIEATNYYMYSNNTVWRFLTECNPFKEKKQIQASNLFEEYVSFCEGSNLQYVTMHEFGNTLKSLNIKKVHKRIGNFYIDFECDGCE